VKLVSLVLVLTISQSADVVRRVDLPVECRMLRQRETRIVVPYGYPGEVCYETAGESLVCETAKARAERLKIR
jgi:hypothetical protein